VSGGGGSSPGGEFFLSSYRKYPTKDKRKKEKKEDLREFGGVFSWNHEGGGEQLLIQPCKQIGEPPFRDCPTFVYRKKNRTRVGVENGRPRGMTLINRKGLILGSLGAIKTHYICPLRTNCEGRGGPRGSAVA